MAGIQAAVFAIILVSVLAAVPVHAQGAGVQALDADFDIHPDNSVSQKLLFTFQNALAGNSTSYTLNENAKNIHIIDDAGRQLEYRLAKSAGNYNLEIFLKDGTKTLAIIYDVDNVIFYGNSIGHFFTEFSFASEIETMTAAVKLPAGSGVYQNEYSPAGAEIVSDGQRIVLKWSMANVQDAFFSVKFTKLGDDSIFFALIAGLLGFLLFVYLYFRQKAGEEFLQGFREDEKKVIAYLQERKLALQSGIQHEFKFSRAKATRIVAHLEAKGLVRKQRYGRTNRLRWLR